MTLENKDKLALINYRVERSIETLEAAETMINSNHLNSAVNRIYYACFYSTEALMLTKDFSTKNHGVLKGEFNKTFIHSGIVDEKYFVILDNAFEKRQTGDYGDFVKFNKEEVKDSLGKAEEFVTEINKMTLKFINKQETEISKKPPTESPEPDAFTRDLENRQIHKRKFGR